MSLRQNGQYLKIVLRSHEKKEDCGGIHGNIRVPR